MNCIERVKVLVRNRRDVTKVEVEQVADSIGVGIEEKVVQVCSFVKLGTGSSKEESIWTVSCLPKSPWIRVWSGRASEARSSTDLKP